MRVKHFKKIQDWQKKRSVRLRQQAVSQLAAMAVADDEPDRAEQLLKELPEYNTDPAMFWAQLYLKRGERVKALKTVQYRLFVLVGQTQSCLITMISEKMEPHVERALEICES